MTPDYARGFRAGIEAAEQKALCGVSIAQGAMDRNGPERWAYAVDLAKDIVDTIRALTPAAPEPTEAPHGYVFHNPDTGWEYAVSHPVLSGEVPDADNIRPATEFEADLCKQISRLKRAAPEPSAPEGYALVPLRMTKAMHDLTSEEGWDWADLLAVAGAITEDQHFDLIAAPEPSEAEKVERLAGLSGFARFWFELGYSACYADVVVKTNCQPPFALTDTLIDRAWEIAPQAYDGDITADQIAALKAMKGEG